MAMGDRIKHTAEEAKGKVKEAVGEATDNHTMQAEGRGDQAAADLKQAGDRVKDATS